MYQKCSLIERFLLVYQRCKTEQALSLFKVALSDIFLIVMCEL